MARPLKNSCDYFPHDGDMRNHRKVKAIITKFGTEGYALWSMILEVLTRSENFRITIEGDIEWELLAADLYTSSDKLKAFISYVITLGLLQKEENQYWSSNLIERFSSLLNKRIRSKKSFEHSKEVEKIIGRKIMSTNGVNRAVRISVFEKCDYKCTVCGNEDSEILDVHHVIPRHKGGNDEISNLTLLCANCHRKEHNLDRKVAENRVSVTDKTQRKGKERKGKEIKGNKKLLADATKEEIKAAAKKIFLEHGLAEWFSEQQAQELSKKYLEKLPIRNLYEIIDAWLEKLDSLPITISINGTKHEPKKSNGSSFSYPTIKAIDVDKKNGRVKLLDGSFIDLNEGDKRALKNNILILDKFYKGMNYE